MKVYFYIFLLMRKYFFFALGGACLFFALFSCVQTNRDGYDQGEIEQDSVVHVVAPPVLTRYGIPVDSFEVRQMRVKRGEFLSSILLAHGVDYPTVDFLAKNFKDQLDVRRIKIGDNYTLFLRSLNDSVQELAYFVLEKSLTKYVVCAFEDSLRVNSYERPVEYRQKRASGKINSSLWNAMVDAGAHPMLAIELSDIYAWTVDFFGIAQGDHFNVVYEEAFVDSTSLGEFKVVVSEFTHLGKAYTAIPFMKDSIWGYYQEDGSNLRKAFLKAPLRYSRISSHFSNSRFHPVLKRYRAHHGIDYAAPTGTPVYTIGDGIVIAKAYQRRGGGNYVKIKHNNVYSTTYMHLHGFAKGLHVGQRVSQGQLIGYVGSTGLSTGPHLDFRVYKNGSPINPLKLKSPPAKSIGEEELLAFEQERDRLLLLLHGESEEVMPAL